MILLWILAFSLAGSVGAIIGASLLMVFSPETRQRLIPVLISYAVGTLLGAAFLAMIPAGLQRAPALIFSTMLLLGIVLFFLMEKMVLWRHCHEVHCEVHGSKGILILIGDAFHNFLDGLAIAAAFLAAVPLGITTSLAVIAHEVPQELGDLSILLDSGYTRTQAFVYNLLSSLTTFLGALAGYFLLDIVSRLIPLFLALSASSFIYIAVADLVPGLHRRVSFRDAAVQTAMILAGIGTIGLFRLFHP
jgi:zinc and cadmium transporter